MEVDQLAGYSANISESVSKVIIFRKRSNRLGSRLIKLIEGIPAVLRISSQSDVYIKSNINLLLVTVIDVLDYYKILSEKSTALNAHLLKYGTDEECFYKWNERLRLISVTLGLEGCLKLFDAKSDRQDLQDDVKYLRESINSIMNDLKEQKLLGSLLDSQENSKAYSTVQNIDTSISIKAKSIKYDKLLGSGAFGEVWKARIGSDFIAVKKIPKNLLDEESRTKLKAEAEVMRSLSHPGIVACIGIVDDGADFCLVMELCTMGSLDNLIKTRKDLDMSTRADLALDIAKAMSYLHRLNVIHRDLKPGNVVLDENMRPKITDFGLALAQSSTMTSVRGTEMGTPAFMAPECFGLAPLFSTKSDVYSYSIIMWELVHMKQAYQGVSVPEIKDSIKDGQRLSIDDSVDASLRELILKSWDQNPRARPSFSEIAEILNLYLARGNGKDAGTNTIASHVTAQKSNAISEKGMTMEGYQTKTVHNHNWLTQYFRRKRLLFGALIVIGLILLGTIISVAVVLSFKASSPNSETTGVTPTPLGLVVSTYAGNGQNATANGQRLFSSFAEPNGILVDLDNNIYISERAGNTIRKIDSTGEVSIIAGTPGISGYQNGPARGALFSEPSGMCLRTDGSIVVADSFNHAIRSISPDLQTVKTIAGDGTPGLTNYYNGLKSRFRQPMGVACDNNNNVYVADSLNNMIRKIDVNNSVTILVGKVNTTGHSGGSFSTAALCLPTILVYNVNSEKLYLADGCSGGIVSEIDLRLRAVTIISGDYQYGSIGYLDGPALSAKFSISRGLSLDKDGNLFLAEYHDSNNTFNRIRFINMTSKTVSTISGYDGSCGQVDGLASIASFCGPTGLGVDSNGNLFVADRLNSVIRKIEYK